MKVAGIWIGMIAGAVKLDFNQIVNIWYYVNNQYVLGTLGWFSWINWEENASFRGSWDNGFRINWVLMNHIILYYIIIL